ncbi:MAG: DUF4384 domain-containing protein [Candidatus Melainabacteria bacterium]|nr:DUF4384 domain-containing protein [Candidatus Melainabacteria bacterium]
MTTLGMLLWDKVTLDVDLVLQIFIGVCELLEETHKQGYAVGTLHPEGIVIVRMGKELTSVHIKKSGAPCGVAFTDEISLPFEKTCYLSPEQLDGLSPSPRSDIYAIGSMMYTALTGTPPFTTKESQKICLVKTTKPLESAYEHKVAFFETVIKRCLKSDESKRYRSVEDLRMELRGVLDGVPPIKQPAQKVVFPFMKLKNVLVSFTATLVILICMASINGTQGLTEPVIEGVWNKTPDQYEYGDPFSITVTTNRKSYAYIIYIDDKDYTVSLYPSKDQGSNVVAAATPLMIGTLSNNMMQVDESKGKIVLVSIAAVRGEAAKSQLLTEQDWMPGQPADHRLRISGSELLQRLSRIKQDYPDVVEYKIEDAPRAKQRTKPLRFGKPDRIEITLGR